MVDLLQLIVSYASQAGAGIALDEGLAALNAAWSALQLQATEADKQFDTSSGIIKTITSDEAVLSFFKNIRNTQRDGDQDKVGVLRKIASDLSALQYRKFAQAATCRMNEWRDLNNFGLSAGTLGSYAFIYSLLGPPDEKFSGPDTAQCQLIEKLTFERAGKWEKAGLGLFGVMHFVMPGYAHPGLNRTYLANLPSGAGLQRDNLFNELVDAARGHITDESHQLSLKY